MQATTSVVASVAVRTDRPKKGYTRGQAIRKGSPIDMPRVRFLFEFRCVRVCGGGVRLWLMFALYRCCSGTVGVASPPWPRALLLTPVYEHRFVLYLWFASFFVIQLCCSCLLRFGNDTEIRASFVSRQPTCFRHRCFMLHRTILCRPSFSFPCISLPCLFVNSDEDGCATQGLRHCWLLPFPCVWQFFGVAVSFHELYSPPSSS